MSQHPVSIRPATEPDRVATCSMTAAAFGAEKGPAVRTPDRAFQVALLAGHEEWMTGALVYVDPFWSEDCVGLRDPLLAELEERLG